MKNLANQPNNKNCECVFCKIINGKLPCKKVYEDDDVLAFLDIANDHDNHTLVVPKNHHENILQTPQSVLSKMLKATNKIVSSYISSGYDGANIINNCGAAAGAQIDHVHFHIIPRKTGDNNKITI